MNRYFSAVIASVFTLLPVLNCLCQAQENPAPQLRDQFTEGRIQGALDFNNYFPSSDVGVKVANGTITLRGEVPSKVDKLFAEKLASKLGGAAIVINNIMVNEKLVPRSRSDIEQFILDQSLSAKIQILFSASKTLNGEVCDIEVKNGIAYLKGSMREEDARKRAGEIASLVYGIRGVRNSIQLLDPSLEVQPPQQTAVPASLNFSDAWISDKVRSLIEFSFAYPGNDLIVVTKNGVVELQGNINDGNLRQEIIKQAQDLLGVNEVRFGQGSQ